MLMATLLLPASEIHNWKVRQTSRLQITRSPIILTHVHFMVHRSNQGSGSASEPPGATKQRQRGVRTCGHKHCRSPDSLSSLNGTLTSTHSFPFPTPRFPTLCDSEAAHIVLAEPLNG